MTNEEIKNYCESYGYSCICISREMDDFIKKNYTEGNDNGKFYKVYKEGNDAKYGHYMINPDTQHRRSSTFDEFYGGIVD